MASTSDWEGLPVHILDQIIDNLICTSSAYDYHRFSAVCKAWHGIATHNHPKYMARYGICPLLLIPTTDPHHRLLLNPVTETTNPTGLSIPDTNNIRCSGSSHGWLAFSEKSDMSIFLLNPYTKDEIRLPQLIDDEDPHIGGDGKDDYPPYLVEYYFNKVILSANPTTHNDYVVVALYGGLMSMAFIRAGDEAWTLTKFRNVFDVTFHKGRIYAAYERDGVISINPHGDTSNKFDFKLIKKSWQIQEEVKIMNGKLVGQFYLVESADGDTLYKVLKVMQEEEDSYDCYAVEFLVSKVEVECDTNESRWMKPDQGLEGHTFFLGNNHSLAVRPSKFHAAGMPPDSIYFTDDYNLDIRYDPSQQHREIDVGVFRVKEGKIGQRFYKAKDPNLPPSIWFEPSGHLRFVEEA